MGGVPGELMGDETGGWKISMKDEKGNKASIWMRYSKTVPNTLRIQAEAADEETASVLMTVLRNLYRDAMKELKRSGVFFEKGPAEEAAFQLRPTAGPKKTGTFMPSFVHLAINSAA